MAAIAIIIVIGLATLAVAGLAAIHFAPDGVKDFVDWYQNLLRPIPLHNYTDLHCPYICAGTNSLPMMVCLL
jgi:hypothetical protein